MAILNPPVKSTKSTVSFNTDLGTSSSSKKKTEDR